MLDVATEVQLATLLSDIGRTISDLTTQADDRLAGLPPGDLTVTVGIGTRLVRGIDPSLPGAEQLATYSREQMTDSCRGGDLWLQICASDPLVVPLGAAALSDMMGTRTIERWRQDAVRGANVPFGGSASAPRNILGFIDGVIAPRGETALAQNVWINAPQRIRGASIVVLRRMELDVERFVQLPVAEQEEIFGRRRNNGSPLSGGTLGTLPDLGAKTPDGRYLIPTHAHLRRTNAAAVGVGTMLRRSYSTVQPAGLLFVSFQNDLATFTKTLDRMEQSDALLPFTTTTAAATFLVLPGFTTAEPLGSGLFS